MRVKALDRLSELRTEDVGSEFTRIHKHTSNNGVRGNYNGIDLGDGDSVGIFRQTGSNLYRVVTRGNFEGKEEVRDKAIDAFRKLGFIDY